MPMLQRLISEVNGLTTRERLKEVDPAAFSQGKSLLEGLAALGLSPSNDEAAYLAGFPVGLQEAVRAMIYADLTAREEPLAITFAWAPGYDDEITFWEVADGETSEGGITIFVRSRYPVDRTAPGRGVRA